jgi:electron transport complex protein RnfD
MSEELKNDNKNIEVSNIILPETDKLIVSTSPHIHGGGSIQKIMLIVIISLLPACFAGVYYFGISALLVLLYCTIGCVGIESLWCYLQKKPQTWKDGSAVVTGLLLGMNLSAGVPWWVCLLGSALAIILGKQLFGGLGYNPFNPALVARVGLLIGLPKIMTTWVVPKNFEYMRTAGGFFNAEQLKNLDKFSDGTVGFMTKIDSLTCATPLGIASTASGQNPFAGIQSPESLTNYFWGNVGGCLGETSALALIIGGIILLAFRLIKWHIPVAYIGTVAVLTGIISHFYPDLTPGPAFHVLAGGLLLGAIFMATDMVTSPMTVKGALIFGVCCGIVTTAIRIWGSYPEGVSFSILFMNAFVPLIDRFTIGKPFGYVKKEKAVSK